ncbi:MAG: ATP-binding protein [Caldilineaceae bacterium]
MSKPSNLYIVQPANAPVTDVEDGQTMMQDFNSSVADSMTLDIPANLQYVNVLGASVCAFLTNVQQLAEPETTRYNLELAIYEIGVNIVNHAYANRHGRIRMSATLSHQPLQVTITLDDTGASFDPSLVPEPRLGELQEHGYGLFLVTQLMDEVEYTPTNAGNTWKLIKNLPVTSIPTLRES